MTTRRILATLALVAACGRSDARQDSTYSTYSAAAPESAKDSSAGAVARLDTLNYPVVRGLYLNRFAAQSPRRMKRLLEIADSTEVNGFVIDAKDEFGLNYKSKRPQLARNAGSGHGVIPNLPALLDSLEAHGVYSIARMVVFKDPIAAELNNAWTIKTPDGGVWKDEKGNAWVNPYNRDVWEYNLGVAEELAKLGFDEIQFDYIRFPEPYKRLGPQVFPGSNGVRKADLLADFLKEAQRRLDSLDVLITADIFGLVTTVPGPLEIGQHWEKISPHVDVVLPMVYPSHYPRGAFGLARPNAEPYAVIRKAIDAARVRDEKLGITKGEHVRPWIQAFSIGKPEYGPAEIKEQLRAVYDAGYNGWILWSPGSRYESFLPALERELKVHTRIAADTTR